MPEVNQEFMTYVVIGHSLEVRPASLYRENNLEKLVMLDVRWTFPSALSAP